jgi:type II secretory pathway component GspD/PulD (secretin)
LLSYIYQGTRGALAAQLNALKQQNKSQVLAAPHVVTLNNIQAKITSKRRVSVPITTGDGTRSDIKTVDAGLEMQITPSLIHDDDPGAKQMVRLNINAKNSSFTAALQTDEKEVQSNVIVPDGSTFILGGLFQDNHLEGESGVLGLMDIPVIGGLFRSKNMDVNRSETIFFITPKLVDHKTLTAYDVGARDYMYYQKASLEQDRKSLQSHPYAGRRVIEDE